MVKNGHVADVPVIQYTPPEGYALDVELYDGAELRRRGRHKPRLVERLEFHVLLYLARRGYEHMVDFETIACAAGSVVVIQPGRVHRFGPLERFHGWMLIFRSEVLPPTPGHGELPAHTLLTRPQRNAASECLERMARDADAKPTPELNTLLASQLRTLLLRVAAANPSASRDVDDVVLERFQRYRAIVEREHHRWHDVASYAKVLGCTQKSLTRATRRIVGMGAKELLTARIVLEAKRRLANTSTAVAVIGDDLGFSEPTNFVKFFRRETGTTPGAFRRAQRP